MYKIYRNGCIVGEVDRDGYGKVDGCSGRFAQNGEPISGEKYIDEDGRNCVVDVWGDIVEDPIESAQRSEDELRWYLQEMAERRQEAGPSDDIIDKLIALPFKGLFKLGRLIVTAPFRSVKKKIAADRLAKERSEQQKQAVVNKPIPTFVKDVPPVPQEILYKYVPQDYSNNQLVFEVRKLENEGKKEEAFELCKTSIEKQDAEAVNLLGTYYEHGIGCEKNMKLAFKLYELAADLGSGFACHNLAYIYSNGVGTTKDPFLAYYYFREGVKRNNLICFNGLGLCYKNGVGVEQNLSYAYHYFYQAAQYNEPLAQNNLGLCYLFGRGCQVNKRLAYYYLKLSHDNGCDVAMKNIKDFDLERYK